MPGMAKIARRRALEWLPPVQCPAATGVAGVTPDRGGVVCGVIARDRALEEGFDMDPVQLAIAREGDGGGEGGDVFLTLKADPSTVENLCCGTDLPVLNAREVPGNRASYTYCPVWQAEHDRIEAGRERLSEKPVPEPVAHGVASHEAPDPWKQARRDLDVLAPPAEV